jgi:signal transduction histidine kinase
MDLASPLHRWRGEGFALGVGLRALVISLLLVVSLLVGLRGLYATALVLTGVAFVVALDLRRSASAADRLLAGFIDSLAAGSDDRPAPQPGARRLYEAIDTALERQRRSRADAQRRLDFAEALVDNVLAAVLVIDEAGIIVAANRAARLGFAEIGLPLDRVAVFGPAAVDRLMALPPGGREVVHLADQRPMLASVTRFSAPGGAPLRLIALQGVPGQLDVVVLKAWQDLVRVLAHEMMNSLTPVCSLSDSISDRLRRPAAEIDPETLSDIAGAAEVISRRSAGLMSFVERYRQVAEPPSAIKAAVSLRELTARLDRLMSPLMREAGVDYASAADDALVEADPALVEQAAINLLKNARDAAAGRPDARVRLACRRNGGGMLLTVEDNGPGLPGEAELAFTPFFTTKREGSGVGLTLARQIAVAHGGGLDYGPRTPTGAIFSLSLP